ncbi:hypothetical protein CKO28_05305 [Rhodovibrio sodomensis]|uniref:HEPN domain-containing protein n=1 Tax=Rhodovibrio sodomensis TaxID=1088 RepID=A0ABS1DBZ1_9PROT|nr:HEPN domain-containing protein [Rhodovibrio sodomensis]MBK1667447.1 hypothetical protein [Rhodovibrio sodomensis]
MTPEAEPHRRQAQRFVRQADKFDAEEDPEAVIHYGYYAIYHAGVAALLQVHGTAPSKHGKVNDAIAQLARNTVGSGQEAAIRHAVVQAYKFRVRADYLADTPIAQRQADAREILACRDEVLKFCRQIVETAQT